MNRTFLLPLVSLSSLAVTGCSSSIDGSWDLIRVTYDGTSQTWPVVDENTTDGTTYTYTYTASMTADKDGTASFLSTYTYAVTGQADETDTYTYTGTWEKVDGKTFDLDFVEMELDMTCTLEDAELDCAAGDGVSLLFAAADE